MSNGLNKVLLIGNLAADSELKMTQGGTAVLKFRMGCSESYTDKAGLRSAIRTRAYSYTTRTETSSFRMQAMAETARVLP